MSALAFTVPDVHHPWRSFRRLVDWTLQWADLPDGLLGHTHYATKTVTLTNGMTQVERRCTIAHETAHIHRGPVSDYLWPREERCVDLEVARTLISWDDLVDAMVWAADEHELADLLWVDVPTAIARLEGLTAGESAELARMLDQAELRNP